MKRNPLKYCIRIINEILFYCINIVYESFFVLYILFCIFIFKYVRKIKGKERVKSRYTKSNQEKDSFFSFYSYEEGKGTLLFVL